MNLVRASKLGQLTTIYRSTILVTLNFKLCLFLEGMYDTPTDHLSAKFAVTQPHKTKTSGFNPGPGLLPTPKLSPCPSSRPSSTKSIQEEDPLFYGYRERVRSMLRYLILEQGLPPNHPLVSSYDCHLFMTTADFEMNRVLENMLYLNMPARDLLMRCFKGCDLQFAYNNEVATSIEEDYVEGKVYPENEFHTYIETYPQYNMPYNNQNMYQNWGYRN